MEDNDVGTNSIEAVLMPAFAEISRRSNVATALQSQDESLTYFSHVEGVESSVPLHIPEQDYVLLSMGTAVLAPRPLNCCHPALRVYGAFPSRDDAIEHASLIDTTVCSIVIVQRSEWILMPQDLPTRDDIQLNRERVAQKLTLDVQRRTESNRLFELAREARRPCEQLTPERQNDDDDGGGEDAEAQVYGRPKRLRAGSEVRGQAVFAFCAIPDKQNGECLIKVLGCFESTMEANAWVRNVGSRDVVHHAIYVAPTCEWIYPNGTLKTTKTFYRIDELQRIMDASDRNAEGVRTFKEWKERETNAHATDAAASTLLDA